MLLTVAIDGLEDLVGFLQDEGFQGIDGLFPVPGAATRRAEPGDDFDEAAEFCGGCVHHVRVAI